MLRLFLLLAVVAAAVSGYSFKSYELDGLDFETFMARTGVKYQSGEIAKREQLFKAELSRVKAHNAAKKSWTETINKFSAMTVEEKRGVTLGLHKGKKHASKGTLLSAQASSAPVKELSSLPTNVDWRTAGIVTPVKDQGHCGSCWAFASTAVIESAVAKATSYLFELSVEQIANCAPNPNKCGGSGGCEGATAEIAFDYVTAQGGILEEFQWGYNMYYGGVSNCSLPSGPFKASINGFVTLMQNDYASLVNALAEVGPVAVSVDASNWHAYEGGVFDGCNQESPDINHAVTAVGYGVEEDGSKYWLVRNSWSPTWGEHGYIKLARQDTREQVCGTDVTPMNGVACSDQPDPVKVCGTCGVLYDSAYPLGAKLFSA